MSDVIEELTIPCPECGQNLWHIKGRMTTSKGCFLPKGVGVKFKCSGIGCNYEEHIDILLSGQLSNAFVHAFEVGIHD